MIKYKDSIQLRKTPVNHQWWFCLFLHLEEKNPVHFHHWRNILTSCSTWPYFCLFFVLLSVCKTLVYSNLIMERNCFTLCMWMLSWWSPAHFSPDSLHCEAVWDQPQSGLVTGRAFSPFYHTSWSRASLEEQTFPSGTQMAPKMWWFIQLMSQSMSQRENTSFRTCMKYNSWIPADVKDFKISPHGS